MPHPVVKQYAQIIPTIDLVFGHLDRTMKATTAVLGTLPVPPAMLQPYVDRWNRGVADLGRARTEIAACRPQIEQTCDRVLTLRQAGRVWQDIAADQAYPLAKSLDRSQLDDGGRYAWGCGAVDRYWGFIARSEDTAEELAGFQDELGLTLIHLADAIDRQSTKLAWGIVWFIAAVVALVPLGIALRLAFARAGANVGGAVGGVIAAVVGALVTLVLGVLALIRSILDFLEASQIVGDEGERQLARLTMNMRRLESEAWPAPHSFGSASDYQGS